MAEEVLQVDYLTKLYGQFRAVDGIFSQKTLEYNIPIMPPPERADQLFDQDPTNDRLLKPETHAFFEKLRSSKDFTYFLLSQIVGDPDQEQSGGMFGSLGPWTQRFVDRIFNATTLADLDAILSPWRAWSLTSQDLETEDFESSNIPEELRGQMEKMSGHHFRYNARQYLFGFTNFIEEAVYILEDIAKPAGSGTIFKVQKITGEPLWPAGGLIPFVRGKPPIKRVFVEGKPFVLMQLFPNEEELDTFEEDYASDREWQRWEALKEGTHVRMIKKRNVTDEVLSVIEATVVGYRRWSLFGESGLSIFIETYIGNITLLVRNDETGLLDDADVKDVRIDSEEITAEDLQPPQILQSQYYLVTGLPSGGDRTVEKFENLVDIGKRIVGHIRDSLEHDSNKDALDSQEGK